MEFNASFNPFRINLKRKRIKGIEEKIQINFQALPVVEIQNEPLVMRD
jgi:hypothetical protein